MWEFDIINTETGEQSIIFGYYLEDALRRHPSYNTPEWICIRSEYID